MQEEMLTLEKFEEASEIVKKVTLETKLVYSDYFSAQTGNRVYLKPENLQFTGAYKLRGAYYKMSTLTDEEREDYNSQLDIDGSGVMGYIEIPTIKVSLPIYHGTSEEVLMAGVGHLEGTSLPVGGTSTHCVLTAHSGMRNLSMFDDIHSLEPGDLVLLHTMNKTLAYKMADSEVVLPEEMESLTIEPGADKVTLVTCTPYGVNDHRLLVHCVRTKYSKKDVDKQKSLAGRHWGKREFAVLIVVVAIVLLLLDIVIHAVRKRRKAKASA